MSMRSKTFAKIQRKFFINFPLLKYNYNGINATHIPHVVLISQAGENISCPGEP